MEDRKQESKGNSGFGSPEGGTDSTRDLPGSPRDRGNDSLNPPAEQRVSSKTLPGEGSPLAKDPSSPLYVKLSSYDGPLDLLLELIKKNEMNIYDIPMAEITQQYLDRLKQMRELDLEVAGEFIVLAATLIYIKSKMLLPTEKDDDEEEGDPRAELVRKLLEYQAFKTAAKELGFLETERGKNFSRQISDHYLSELSPEDTGIDTFSANFYDLAVAFQGVLAKKGAKEPHEVFEEQISIEEKIIQMQSFLIEKKRILFHELFPEGWTRNDLIATFLALLEVIRTRFACVVQEEHFGEIMIEKREDSEREG